MNNMFKNQLKGKTLLYLGGIPRARYVVSRARKLGIYVIVADYDPNSPAKKVANEGVLVNALDIDALETLCKDKHIEGILSGYADIILPVCLELSKRLSLPCYMTADMLRASTDKEFFKELSEKYDVPVPKTYHICKDQLEKACDKLDYPVFMKPLDGSGSRGASACYRKEDFEKQYKYALSFSKKGVVTVEDFLHGTEFILDYILVDGEPYLASLADRYSVEGRPAAVNHPNLMILPSKHLDKYYSEVDGKVRNMFKKSGFKDGVIFLQGYADEKIAFYEMGCRLGGTWPYIDEYFHGINPMDMLFCHSLTGRMLPKSEKVQISARFNGNAAVIYFLSQDKEGNIAKVEGVDDVRLLPYVVTVMQYYKAGDHFSLGTLTDVLFLAVHLVADDFQQLKERINKVYELVGYYDKDGKSLLAPVYDVEQLKGY